jgi:integrase
MNTKELQVLWSDLIAKVKPCKGILKTFQLWITMINHNIIYGKFFENIKDVLDRKVILVGSKYTAPRVKKMVTTLYTMQELELVRNTPMDPMGGLVLSLLMGPALRLGGILYLLVEDVYDSDNNVPRNGVESFEKHGTKREWHQTPEILAALGRYMPTHTRRSKYLFPMFTETDCNEPRNETFFGGKTKEIFKRSGVGFRGLHGFRHRRITDINERRDYNESDNRII